MLLYEEFARAVGRKNPWSLYVVFDDLTGDEMKSAVKAAEKAKAEGLAPLDKEERQLLLRAGATEFFRKLLAEVK